MLVLFFCMRIQASKLCEPNPLPRSGFERLLNTPLDTYAVRRTPLDTHRAVTHRRVSPI
jgi:hypothetical protein